MIDSKEYLKDKTILIVEDEDDTRVVNADILSLLVDRVIESVDGLDGLEKFKENQKNIDLLVVDINMPKMDGLTMCQEIRKIDSDVPILIVTGHDQPKFRKESQECSVSRYLLKPVDGYELIDNIKDVLLNK